MRLALARFVVAGALTAAATVAGCSSDCSNATIPHCPSGMSNAQCVDGHFVCTPSDDGVVVPRDLATPPAHD